MSGHIAFIRVSWPEKHLMGHAKGHWRPKAAATKAYREEASILAQMQQVKKLKGTTPYLTFTYHPPDRLRRDIQNVHIAMKPVIDGIADAMGQDDSTFLCQFPLVFGEVVSGGAVTVEVRAEGAE